MGYELNIVRKKDWENPTENSNITFEEWSDYANQDYDLELNISGGIGFYLWKGYPEDQSFGIPGFEYRDGYISTKNPNFLVIQKMLSISEKLNGRIYDEEGEPFDTSFLGL